MAKKRPSRNRKKGNTSAIVTGTFALLVSAGLLAGIGIFAYQAYSRTKLDDALCPVTGPVAVTALLLDTTDPITNKTLTDARNKFEDVMAQTTIGELVAIYGLTESPGELVTMFEGCNPGDGSTVDQWTSNPKLQQKKWEDAFGKPLDEISRKLPEGKVGNQSPIMAAIQSIKLKVFDRHKRPDTPRSLIVMSDMIEHTDLYSQYKSDLDIATYKNSPASADYRTSLKNIDLTIWYIDRGIKKFDGRQLIDFWAEWVVDNEGASMKMFRLEGLNPQAAAGGNT